MIQTDFAPVNITYGKPVMDLLSCGQKVITKLSKIEGIITSISIKFNYVSYEVSYFHEGEYKQIWLNEAEFDTENQQRQAIGFKQNNGSA